MSVGEVQAETWEFFFGKWARRHSSHGLDLVGELDGGVAAMEPAMQAFLQAEAAQFEVLDLRTKLRDDGGRWRAASALQKAIRRGQRLEALRAATALGAEDISYLWSRLAVIAVEDVGPADPYLVALTLSCVGRMKWRKEVGERRLLQYIVSNMAEGVKSRSLCDFSSLVDYCGVRNSELRQIVLLPIEEIKKVVLDPGKDDYWELRQYVALWALAGTARYKSEKLPPRTPPRGALLEALDVLGVDPLVKYVVRHSMRAHMYCIQMAVALPVVWPILNEHNVWSEDNDISEEPRIAGLFSSALDMHCQDGRRALAYFSKACDDAREFFAKHPNLRKVESLGAAVFEVEGGLLNKELIWQGHREWRRMVQKAEIATACGGNYELGLELVKIVRCNMERLHKSRTRIMEGSRR